MVMAIAKIQKEVRRQSVGVAIAGIVLSLLAIGAKAAEIDSEISDRNFVGPAQAVRDFPLQATSLSAHANAIDLSTSLDLLRSEIRGVIPRELIFSELLSAIDKLDRKKIKDTKFNNWTLLNADLRSLDRGGVTLAFSVNLRHRERIGCLFGKCHYTPWISVTLHGTTSIGINIRNNVVHTTYRGHDVRGQKYYTSIANILDRIFKKQTNELGNNIARDFDNLHVLKLIINNGDPNGASTHVFGIPLEELAKHVEMDADIRPEGLDFKLKLSSRITLVIIGSIIVMLGSSLGLFFVLKQKRRPKYLP